MQVFPARRRLLVSPIAFQKACRRASTSQPYARRTTQTRPRDAFDDAAEDIRGSPRRVRTTAGRARSQLKDDARRTGSRARPEDTRPAQTSNSDSVRWFEKDADSGDVQRITSDPEEAEATEVRRRLQDMNTDMRRYDGSIDSKDFHEKVLELFPKEDRKELAVALAEERQRKEDVTKSLQIDLKPSALEAPLLRQLNRHVSAVVENPDDLSIRRELWKWYLRAKRSIPGLDARIPRAAWQVIWASQLDGAAANRPTWDRTMDIVQGMESAGLTLTTLQTSMKYEAMIGLGREKEAIAQWQGEFDRSRGQSEVVLQNGISLFASCRDLNQGLQVLRKYFDNFPKGDPRVLHNMIQAAIQTGSDHIAFSLYLKLRQSLGDKMQMQDYDLVVAKFLAMDKKDLALAVFRDMMMQGTTEVMKDRKTEEEESYLRDKTMERIGVMQSQSLNSHQLNRVSLQSLVNLPVRWQNKYFFGSWIKKLIGMKDLRGAAKVIELMYQRKIAPDPTHVNGLIGGYMRSGLAVDEQRGEALAWAMIRSRLRFVKERSAEKMIERPLVDIAMQKLDTLTDESSKTAKEPPMDIAKPLPPATKETFNLLGLHYLLKERWTHLQQLSNMLSPAEIRLNSFFMNHILYMKLYTEGPKAMWDEYQMLKTRSLPDLETFNCYHHALQIHLSEQPPGSAKDFPGSRFLFGKLLRWVTNLNANAKYKLNEFDDELYARIITCLCISKDFAGCIVAMHAIKLHFRRGVNPDVEDIIITGLSNLFELRAPMVRGRRSRRALATDADRAGNVRRVLGLIRQRRVEALREKGVISEEGVEGVNVTENIDALSELIRTVMMKVKGDPDWVEENIRVASLEMESPGIDTGDKSAHDVG